jgi:hypothetical protein
MKCNRKSGLASTILGLCVRVRLAYRDYPRDVGFSDAGTVAGNFGLRDLCGISQA